MQKDAGNQAIRALSLRCVQKTGRYRVVAVSGGPLLRARLAALGMEAGAIITLERADGGGIVVACRTTRTAMSRRTAAFLSVVPVSGGEDGAC